LSAIPSLLSGEKIFTNEAAGLSGGLRHMATFSLEQEPLSEERFTICAGGH
jgi:hypothetical protein